MAQKVSPTEATALLAFETCAGKEVFAAAQGDELINWYGLSFKQIPIAYFGFFILQKTKLL